MLIGRSFIVFAFIILIAATADVSAQTGFAQIESGVTKLLLKKDLREAIKEAEKSSANDLKSLLWRLTLYRRSANFEKISLTVRQIIEHRDFQKNNYQIGSFLTSAIQSTYFQDTEILQFYLQKVGLDENIYAKFVSICRSDKTACDIEGFDEWLAQKSSEAEKSSDGYFSDSFEWTARQIAWRKQFGLDYQELQNRFLEDVRKDPTDLAAALRYLTFFKTPADLLWLAENFSSPQAYSYYELGNWIGNMPNSLVPNSDDAPQIRRVAVRFLLKSLEMPFNEKDVQLIFAYRLRNLSVPPNIKNYEKQLRFWTKQSLAENYKDINEPQNAQPIVEELTTLDKSDILSDNPTRLAGAVQAGSGARSVESEILRQQATRQDSYLYWQERINYYDGRDEPEQMFSSYMQAFAAVPFDISNQKSASERLFYTRRFADFVEYRFGQNANEPMSDDWGPENKRRHQFWLDAENFLRGEFAKTKSNIKYSNELMDDIAGNDFKNLAGEILSKNPELLTSAAKNGLLNSSDRLLSIFLKNENIPPTKKDEIFNELIKIADNTGIKSAWVIFEAISIGEAEKYISKLVPLLEKHFAKSLAFVKTYKPSDDDESDFRNLPNKYAETLFRIYLAADNRKSAEKLMLNGYYSFKYGIAQLIGNAARRDAFDEALRYWKMKANFNREDLEDLSYLKGFPVLAQGLRDFYRQMKIAEPFSPIPDLALQKLN